MDVGIGSVGIQCILYSLDLFVSFGLGVSVRHSNIQAIFLQGNGVISLSAHLHLHADLIVVRNSNLSRRSCQAGVNINQAANRDFDHIAAGNGQLNVFVLGVVSTAGHNQILAQRNGQFIAAKYRQLNGAGACVISRCMHNAGQGSSNRVATLGNTQHALIVGNISNKLALNALNGLDLSVDVIGNSLGGRHIVVAGVGSRDLSHGGLVQLDIAGAIEHMQGKVTGAHINNALHLAGTRQGAHQLAALGVFNCALKNLQSVSQKIQGVVVLCLQGFKVSFGAIIKFYFCHNCLSLIFTLLFCRSKFLPNKSSACSAERFNSKLSGIQQLYNPRLILALGVFNHYGLPGISVAAVIQLFIGLPVAVKNTGAGADRLLALIVTDVIKLRCVLGNNQVFLINNSIRNRRIQVFRVTIAQLACGCHFPNSFFHLSLYRKNAGGQILKLNHPHISIGCTITTAAGTAAALDLHRVANRVSVGGQLQHLILVAQVVGFVIHHAVVFVDHSFQHGLHRNNPLVQSVQRLIRDRGRPVVNVNNFNFARPHLADILGGPAFSIHLNVAKSQLELNHTGLTGQCCVKR
nr:MAG TPA: hypothetical protein [Caudoviricetes sp.]